MHELPTWLKKTLDALGMNSSRAQWKYHYFREGLKEKRSPLGGRAHWLTRRQKACVKCGTMVSPEETRCPECGARIPSRVGYLLRRASGFMGMEFGAGVTPVFLFVIIGIYVILKVREYQLDQSGILPASVDTWSYLLFKWGALNEKIIRADGEWWRIITMGLLHGGIIHLLFNCYAFFQIGPLIEDEIGPWRTLVLITVAQVGAAFGSLYLGDLSVYWKALGLVDARAVGASGFLFGLIGFGVGYYFKQQDFRSRALHKIFVQWGLYAMVFGFIVPNIDNSAHIGGAVTGIALGLLFQNLPSTYHSRGLRVGWRVAGGLCILTWVGSIVLMLLS